jgi:hypothetical protein
MSVRFVLAEIRCIDVSSFDGVDEIVKDGVNEAIEQK